MKTTGREFGGAAPRAAANARLFFFCGADEAGAQDGAAMIAQLLPEPGERIELSGAELRKDPVRLGDEARSQSLFGGARHILVRAQGDEAHDAVANLIAIMLETDAAPCPVLIVATGATERSRTAKLLVGRADALVAVFHPPTVAAAAAAVRRMADAAGLRIDQGVAERLARATGLDTRLAQSEITKLALFLDAAPERPGRVDAAALDAIAASTEDDGFGPLVDTVFGGDAPQLAGQLRRIRELGLSPVGVLLACERRAALLAALAAKLGPRGNVSALLQAESAARRIFWTEQGAIGQQLQIWRGHLLERLVTRLTALHRRLLTESQHAQLLLEQGLAEIARVAAGRG